MAKRSNSHPVALEQMRSTWNDSLPQSQVMLTGEDPEQYSRILREVGHSVEPVDIIEEFWVRDVTDLLWEVLRLRRLKGCLLAASVSQGLTQVLGSIVGLSEAIELVGGWCRGDQSMKDLVHHILDSAGLSFDAVLAEGLAARINEVDRIDRMIASAESRRNAILREISRHRDAVAMKLARASEAIEEAEFAEISPTDDVKACIDGQQP
ncbi:hypothetical protein MKK58_00050 [Methylobacterium sp. J-078]|uniref:hypothetical protein n=1 Tax=Methylobacterium sp. J-078 TaxID=2836657 RepID=UPI001FBA010D|nr:hypothetical protein [Methylobacterium sp. J-078]MCJ2042957.1 hypothetical protein [Methylobacterium sp. J-078]